MGGWERERERERKQVSVREKVYGREGGRKVLQEREGGREGGRESVFVCVCVCVRVSERDHLTSSAAPVRLAFSSAIVSTDSRASAACYAHTTSVTQPLRIR